MAAEGGHQNGETADVDLLREMVSAFIAALMGAEADALCGAAYGERSPERVNTNGYRSQRFDTGPARSPGWDDCGGRLRNTEPIMAAAFVGEREVTWSTRTS